MAAGLKEGSTARSDDALSFDVVIIGAGISGINAAYRIQNDAPPNLSYVILEGRESLGGTWDLFKYPGIRSDSDIFTFGFAWSPWTEDTTMGSGEQIVRYLNRSVRSAGIDQNIRYRHSVESANWSSEEKRWELNVTVAGKQSPARITTRFVVLGTGYYDYETPLQTTIPGIENFKGKLIHPQFWPEDYNYTNKDVVIIGSGATAVTILPSVANKAKRVTMLQRSPSYIASRSNSTPLTRLFFMLLPAYTASLLSRFVFLIISHWTTFFARTFPNSAKHFIRRMTERQLPPSLKWDPNFNPRYEPWDQRFCACPDGDFFAALRSGKATVVTDTINKVTAASIELTSGAALHPDVIVTATGLKLKFGGGIRFSVDGKDVSLADKYAWKTAMLQDMPNLLYVTGYERASWTLGADVSAQLFTRLLWSMKRKGATVVVPRVAPGDENMTPRALLALSSTYLKDAKQVLPKGGEGQWSPRKFYFADMAAARWGDISTGLVMT